MAMQLSSFILRRSYQLLAKLAPKDISIDDAFDQSADYIYGWARYKFRSIFRDLPYYKGTFEGKQNGMELGVVYQPDKGIFVLRAVHQDSDIAGRSWITDVELFKNNDECTFAVRLSVSSPQSCTEDIPFSRPQFVGRIMNEIGLCDVQRLEFTPKYIESNQDVEEFVRFLEDSERSMPIVLLTPCNSVEESTCNGYMMDAEKMANDLRGAAHVYQIASREANDHLNDIIGKQWSAFNGAVRTYYPGLSFETSELYQHPLVTQQTIRIRNANSDSEDNACMQDVTKHIKNYIVRRRISWEEKDILFYTAVYHQLLQEQRLTNAKNQDELIEYYKMLVEEIQSECEEHKQAGNAYANDCETYREQCDQYRKLVGQLKAQISSLRHQLKMISGNTDGYNIPLDGGYADIEAWIDEYYPDRLFLHSRAVRSLKDACYENTELVYKCLKLLATAYYDYRIGNISYDDFSTACKQIDSGLEERAAITDVAAGMEGDTYYVQHHGRRCKLERHLTKGRSKDRRYCLRIYFFWDEQNQVIVIGDLPHHLDTSAT